MKTITIFQIQIRWLVLGLVFIIFGILWGCDGGSVNFSSLAQNERGFYWNIWYVDEDQLQAVPHELYAGRSYSLNLDLSAFAYKSFDPSVFLSEAADQALEKRLHFILTKYPRKKALKLRIRVVVSGVFLEAPWTSSESVDTPIL